jgi:primosomal protein N' (replication factor Y)
MACAMHSRLSGAERLSAWRRIRSGEVRIVAGPRSAVFAPVKNLGLIIIDEEQDASYKAGNTPRYHARQVAMHRCSIAGDDGGKPLLLMGSATPSVEAWAMIRDKRITRLTLTKRLAGGGLPSIEVVNMARVEGCLSPLLKEEIEKTAEQGRQSILFLNRRGFAYFYHCPKCGYELTCKHCSVSLTWHKGKTPDKDRAVCHYCGFSMPPPRACPNCGSLEAGFTGFGTEMIEEEVRRSFPHLRVERADADSTAKKGALEDILGRFKKGEIDILLGTQMVAKGLNFPGVRLVGVVLADTGLHLPDFRAAERTFSLIVQVAGRAGRYFPNGKVVVQTLRPSDPAISCACGLEIEQYYSRELEQRKALNFPPYSRLIRFVVRGKDLPRVKAAVARLAERAAPCLPRDAELLGPAECPLSLIAGNYRRQIIIRGPHIAGLHKAAVQALAGWETAKENGCYLETDIDPVSLL